MSSRCWIAVVALGCGGGHVDSPPAKPPTCLATEVEVSGVCSPKFDDCGQNEVPMAGGGCRPVGVSSCAPGFRADPSAGCTAILPSEPCKVGSMALLGEETCRLVAPCPAGTYGDIPVESSTVFVDAAAGRDDGDGSKGNPVRTVTEGVALARTRSNPIVAIAAGKYLESVRVDRSMRLYGRCPSMVEIAGDDPSKEALSIEVAAEVHGLAFSGPGVGLTVFDAAKVRIERVWVHDAAGGGIDVERPDTETEVEIVDSLVEKTKAYGVFNVGAKVTLERVVVRDVVPLAGDHGMGVLAIAELSGGPPPDTTVRASVVERTEMAGIASFGGTATVEGTLVRDIAPTKKPKTTSAGLLLGETDDLRRGDFHVTGCVVERTGGAGVYLIASHATLENTVVADALPFPDGDGGVGVVLAEGSDATIAATLVRGGSITGISLVAAKASVTDTIVRDVGPGPFDPGGGLGIAALALPATKGVSELTLRTSLVERCRMVSVLIAGSSATVADSMVRDTAASASGAYGDGISVISMETDAHVVFPATVDVLRTVVSGSARGGLTLFGATAHLGSSFLTCNLHDIDLSKRYSGPAGALREFALEDQGGNRCGCEGTSASCRAESSSLDPLAVPSR
jgi:hypothetical protein